MLDGDPLTEWLRPRRQAFVHKMQLRKEHDAPFFHQYVVFSLHHDAGCFRIDRRQRPDEPASLDSIWVEGVEAHDTLEKVASLDESLFCSSDCLIEIEFEYFTMTLISLLRVCWAIRGHHEARAYTLQRYNCYFFAQTIITCAAQMKFGRFSSASLVGFSAMYRG